MALLSEKRIVEALEAEIKRKAEERDNASKNEWFDKAAKLDNEIEGIRKAKFIVQSGDCEIK